MDASGPHVPSLWRKAKARDSKQLELAPSFSRSPALFSSARSPLTPCIARVRTFLLELSGFPGLPPPQTFPIPSAFPLPSPLLPLEAPVVPFQQRLLPPT